MRFIPMLQGIFSRPDVARSALSTERYPESVSSVHPTPPGYAVGTMIDVQNGSEIVKEPFAEVVKKLNETGLHGPAR